MPQIKIFSFLDKKKQPTQTHTLNKKGHQKNDKIVKPLKCNNNFPLRALDNKAHKKTTSHTSISILC